MKLERVNQRYYFSRWWHPRNWWGNIRRFFLGFKNDHDRAKYGVSHFDCWDLDNYMLKTFKNGLKIYKKDTIGHPALITEQEWDNILDHMTKLLDIILTDESPEAIEVFDLYWDTCDKKDFNDYGDKFLKEEWLQKQWEWEEYKQDCRYEFYDLLKEWGGHLWW